MRFPEIELLWWQGCPSTERALSELREALRETGLEAADVTVHEIETDEDAATVGFRGSPTILIDGSDVAGASASEEPFGLSCRVYRRRDGTISPTPDPEDLRAALRARARGRR
jgi:glutaredoxin